MQIENRQQLLTVLAIAAVVLFAADRLVLTPLKGVWDARSERVTKLRNEITEGKSLIAREQIIRRRWEMIRHNSLPNNQTATQQKVYNAINQWAQDSGSTVTATTPQWKQDADDYMTYDCRVDASGDISSLSKFLYDLESDPMALKLELVELASRDKTGKQLGLSLEFSGLVLTPKAQPQP